MKEKRTIKKSTDVTPTTAAILAEMKVSGMSLGDIIEKACREWKAAQIRK